MHLKTSRNGASFTEYKNFIEQNGDYPRINRIRYLAEEKDIFKKSLSYFNN